MDLWGCAEMEAPPRVERHYHNIKQFWIMIPRSSVDVITLNLFLIHHIPVITHRFIYSTCAPVVSYKLHACS